jgi:hypothetical protein
MRILTQLIINFAINLVVGPALSMPKPSIGPAQCAASCLFVLVMFTLVLRTSSTGDTRLHCRNKEPKDKDPKAYQK